MYIKKFFPVILFAGFLLFNAYQCSSTELTSAKLYYQQKNFDKAIEALQKEVQKNPQSDEGYYWLGIVLGEKERYSESLDALNKSLGISNKFEKEITSAKLSFWGKNYNKGVDIYQRAFNSTNEDSAKILFEKAIDAYQTAIQFAPDSSGTYRNLALAYVYSDQNEKAIEPLEKLITKEDSSKNYQFLGKVLYAEGMKYKSKYESSRVLQDSLEGMKYLNKSISLGEEGRKKFPDDSEILFTLSNSYIAANKIEVALDAFKTGVEREPNNQYYRYNYGVLLLGKNDYTGAEEQFKKALEIDPQYYNASYNLAVTYVKWGANINKLADEKGDLNNKEYKEKYQKALPYLEKIVQEKKDDAAMWELLGKVYSVLGMTDDASNAFKKADELRK